MKVFSSARKRSANSSAILKGIESPLQLDTYRHESKLKGTYEYIRRENFEKYRLLRNLQNAVEIIYSGKTAKRVGILPARKKDVCGKR